MNAKTALELLADPRCYPERTSRVEQIATHISWIFLTDHFAYKLKKPVRYDFLDFSTVEKRRVACMRELQLNRRLAPEIYLHVVPITKNKQGVLALGPREGAEPIDWVVQMRRLPSDQSLEHLICSHRLRKPQVDQLSRMLAQFYRQLPPVTINVEAYRRRLEQHIDGNHRELIAWAGQHDQQSTVRRLRAAQLRLLRVAPELLDNRVRDGRIIDGHGDLRPEHIYFHPQPLVIDCIEFNDEFRQLDVLDELAFLAIECTHLDAPWVGGQIVDYYHEVSRDNFSWALLDFYKVYRCCVRAKVAILRAKQVDEASRKELEQNACTYLRIAEGYAAHLAPPVVIVVYGLSGSGKSTLAEQLGALLGIDVLNTDTIRQEIFGRREATTFSSGLYQPAKRAQVYDQMLAQAERILTNRLSVILDGTFSAAGLRVHAAELAQRYAAVPVFVHCQCPTETALQRIVSRATDENSLSDATTDIYERQRHEFEPDPDQLTVYQVDTSLDVPTVVESVFSAIKTAAPFSSVSAFENAPDSALLDHRAISR
jgi:aminoglycoside phosphotransferase family enzyme/predicted kinase